MMRIAKLLVFTVAITMALGADAHDFVDHVSHEYADSDGVKIHYAKAGSGPLAVFIHGFPDYWYSWRNQMEGLSSDYTVAALDTRGYNKSDQPEGVENYDMKLLVQDVAAVIKNEGKESAVIIGHDWGGVIAWSFAAAHPDMTEKLIIVNLPHPKGLQRELAKMGQQHSNSQYARNFQKPDSHKSISAVGLATMLAGGDEKAKARYQEAFENSSPDAMMNYYRANYPVAPYEAGAFLAMPKIKMPVLQFHGLDDGALLAGALNDTWLELEQDWTLVTLPNTGHWSHHEKADEVTDMMKAWLKLHE